MLNLYEVATANLKKFVYVAAVDAEEAETLALTEMTVPEREGVLKCAIMGDRYCRPVRDRGLLAKYENQSSSAVLHVIHIGATALTR